MEYIDLTNEICPMTFVKAQLHLEEVEPGGSIGLILKEGEATRDVPGSMAQEGHSAELIKKDGDRYFFIVTKKSRS